MSSQFNKSLRTRVKKGRIYHVKKCLFRGADVDARNSEGETVLMRACDLGHIDIVRLLIDRGADINARNFDNYDSPIINASQSGHIAIVRLLLDRGANVDGLHADIDCVDNALIVSSSNGNTELMRLLLERGAVRDRDLALSVASENGHAGCLRLLLEHGVYPDTRYENETWRETPLMEASKQGHIECVRLLLDHGAEVNADDGERSRALVNASGKGHTDVVRLLLDRGAKIKLCTGRNFWDPLHAAIRLAHVDCVHFLLERGADNDNRGWVESHRDFVSDRSALMVCFSKSRIQFPFEYRNIAPEKYTECMHLLLKYGAYIATIDVGKRVVDNDKYPAATPEQLTVIAQCLRERAATTIQKNFRKHSVIKKMMNPNHEYGRALLLNMYKKLIDGEW
jgi:ankyrin repeat protein